MQCKQTGRHKHNFPGTRDERSNGGGEQKAMKRKKRERLVEGTDASGCHVTAAVAAAAAAAAAAAVEMKSKGKRGKKGRKGMEWNGKSKMTSALFLCCYHCFLLSSSSLLLQQTGAAAADAGRKARDRGRAERMEKRTKGHRD